MQRQADRGAPTIGLQRLCLLHGSLSSSTEKARHVTILSSVVVGLGLQTAQVEDGWGMGQVMEELVIVALLTLLHHRGWARDLQAQAR